MFYTDQFSGLESNKRRKLDTDWLLGLYDQTGKLQNPTGLMYM